MNPIKQRIAIAKACGWRQQEFGDDGFLGWVSPHGNGYRPWPSWVWRSYYEEYELPDYLNDLNAMHEAEKMLTGEQWDLYCDYLGGSLYSCASATASHRAEAFLKTIRKWNSQS